MKLLSKDDSPKGWYLGPWDSNLEIPIGYANQGIQEHHYHNEMNDIYLIASGTSTAIVNGREVKLKKGDVLVVEPLEKHTFKESSDDYFHFVINMPFVKEDKVTINEC